MHERDRWFGPVVVGLCVFGGAAGFVPVPFRGAPRSTGTGAELVESMFILGCHHVLRSCWVRLLLALVQSFCLSPWWCTARSWPGSQLGAARRAGGCVRSFGLLLVCPCVWVRLCPGVHACGRACAGVVGSGVGHQALDEFLDCVLLSLFYPGVDGFLQGFFPGAGQVEGLKAGGAEEV